MNYIVAGFLVLVGSAIICHTLAKMRGADAVFWGVMGVIFGPLVIPFVFFEKKL